jgi:hypothetical protein
MKTVRRLALALLRARDTPRRLAHATDPRPFEAILNAYPAPKLPRPLRASPIVTASNDLSIRR